MRVNRQPLKASARRSRLGRRRLRRTAGGDASHAYDCVAAVETPGKKPVHELCRPQLARLIPP
jgi:hypothetical protein